MEAKATAFSPHHRVPTGGDMDVDTAVQKATEALMGTYGFNGSFFDSLTAYASLAQGNDIWNDETDSWCFEYLINFDAAQQPLVCGVLMVSDTGEILECRWQA